MATAKYETKAFGKEVFEQLVGTPADGLPWFPCVILVPAVGDDFVKPREITIYVHRIPGKSPAHVLPNKNAVYETKARIEPDGQEYDITITPVDPYVLERAEVVVSREMMRALNAASGTPSP
jgi:hypothetical protein